MRVLTRVVGKAGSKVFGRIGGKLIPVIGWISLGWEVAEAAKCAAACQDGVYSRSEDWGGGEPVRKRRPEEGGGCGLPSCFVSDTPVLTSQGFKSIQDIRPGDTVIAWDPIASTTLESKVNCVVRARATEVLAVYTSEGVVFVTKDHPFLVCNAGWTDAGALKEGDELQTISAQAGVVKIETLPVSEEVWTLSVDSPHTFIVTNQGIIVHNKILH